MDRNIRTEFPIFKTHPDLVYLDSSATALKPKAVIDAANSYYTDYTANIHRGLYGIAQKADEEYEKVRSIVARFINATSDKEVVFVPGTTAAINMLAASIEKTKKAADENIVITEMEHHSNMLPWRYAGYTKLPEIRWVGFDKEGNLKLDEIEKKVNEKTRVIAVSLVSNVLGTINDIQSITRIVKDINSNCLVVVDAAQAAPQIHIDVQELGCDFLIFSGHKLYGPTGVGVLWGKFENLNRMHPFLGGGTVATVGKESYGLKSVPQRLEAGTPNIAGVIGMGAGVEWLQKFKNKDKYLYGMKAVRDHNAEITKYALELLSEVEGVEIYGPMDFRKRGGLVAFNLRVNPGSKKKVYIHAHDVAQVLADRNICVRAGHHCAQILHRELGINGSVRASFGIYTTKGDIDELIEGLTEVRRKFGETRA